MKPPKIADVSGYSKQWWLWWGALQPNWRTSDTSQFGRELIGQFDTLIRPGKNGMFIVLLSLCWWADSLDYPTEDILWRNAMNDVAWVLSRLAQGKRPLETVPPSPRPHKKRK